MRIRLLFIILLLASLSVVMYNSLNIKDTSIREVYEDLTFMRISLEARQYISLVEYDIKYGRQLENFYNMQETLKGVQSCSSYIEGVYIVSASAKLLYQSGINPKEIRLVIPKDQVYSMGKLYSMEKDAGHYYLTNPIKDGSGKIVGYLIMYIGNNAVNNVVSDYNSQNKVQTGMIFLEIFGIGLYIIKRVRPDKQNRLALKLMLILSLMVSLAAALDSGVLMARFYFVVNDAVHQSADKMAQSLQSEVDSVIAKGISTERIYDLNSWLAKNSSELTIITSLTLDRNGKITAAVSPTYINSIFNKFLLRTFLLLISSVLTGLAACGIIILFRRPKESISEITSDKGVTYV